MMSQSTTKLFCILLVVLVSCEQNPSVPVEMYPDKVMGSWEYVVEKQYFKNNGGGDDSTIVNDANRRIFTQTEVGLPVDQVFLKFFKDSLYHRDHYDAKERKVVARQIGDWYFKSDTLMLQTKDIWQAYHCFMLDDSTMDLRLELDTAKKEFYTAHLKRVR